MSDVRYPIGKFQRPEKLSSAERRALIDQIAAAPSHMRKAVSGLKEQQLNTPYREGGWMVRQVVHHLPDSHVSAASHLNQCSFCGRSSESPCLFTM